MLAVVELYTVQWIKRENWIFRELKRFLKIYYSQLRTITIWVLNWYCIALNSVFFPLLQEIETCLVKLHDLDIISREGTYKKIVISAFIELRFSFVYRLLYIFHIIRYIWGIESFWLHNNLYPDNCYHVLSWKITLNVKAPDYHSLTMTLIIRS